MKQRRHHFLSFAGSLNFIKGTGLHLSYLETSLERLHVQVCKSHMSSAVPLILLVISSPLLFQFIFPFSPFFTYFLLPFSSCPSLTLIYSLSSIHSQTCSLLLPLLLCVFFQYLPFLIILPVYLLKFTLLIKPQRKSSLWGAM